MTPDGPRVSFPPTVVIVHRKERREKCSVEPLRGRPDIQFLWYPLQESIPLTGYVRLGLDGPLLSLADAPCGLILLDATWRLANRMEKIVHDVPVRSLPILRTAYPRRSKVNDDPAEGLATIEALYAAYVLLGRDATGLLDSYRWRDEFLRLNASLSGR